MSGKGDIEVLLKHVFRLRKMKNTMYEKMTLRKIAVPPKNISCITTYLSFKKDLYPIPTDGIVHYKRALF
jgi:hypothetical protein